MATAQDHTQRISRNAELLSVLQQGRLASQRQNFLENQELNTRFHLQLNNQKAIRSAKGTSLVGGINHGITYSPSNAKEVFSLPFSMLAPADLYNQSPMGSIPKNNTYTVRKSPLTPVYYLTWDSSAELDTEAWVLAHCAFLGIMYKDKLLGEPLTHEEVYSAYATFISLYITNQSATSWNTYLKHKDILLIETRVRSRDEYCEKLCSMYPATLEMLEQLGDTSASAIPHILALISVQLQTMAKHVQDPGYQMWFKNRYTSAMNTIGRGTVIQTWKDDPPRVETLQLLNQTMSSSFEVRRYIFQVMSAMSQQVSLAGCMFKHTVGLMAWAEATYVATIDKYLIKMAPELLSTKLLEGEEMMLSTMLDFMKSLGENQCYVKLLHPADECYPIHRGLLNKAIITAILIAKKCEPSFRYYTMSNADSEFCQKMSKIIDEWFNVRERTDQANMAEDPNSRMSAVARKLAVQRIERQLEDNINFEQTREMMSIY